MNANKPAKRGDDATAELARAAGYARKQKWKAQPGNRYTSQELRQMSASLGPFRMTQADFHVMYLK
jgi:hypothetical protein